MNDSGETSETRYAYPAHFSEEAGVPGFMVTFRDVPEAYTQGSDEADAIFMGQDILNIVLADYMLEGRPIPTPSSPLPGERLISVTVPDPLARQPKKKA